jgi:hypothetical protein
MVYATATALYSILTIDLRQWSRWLAMFLFTSMAVLTVVHCNATEPSIQRLCFTTMIYGTFIRCYMLIKRVKDVRVRKEMKTIAKAGTGKTPIVLEFTCQGGGDANTWDRILYHGHFDLDV